MEGPIDCKNLARQPNLTTGKQAVSEGKCETLANDASLSIVESSVPVLTKPKKKAVRKKGQAESTKSA